MNPNNLPVSVKPAPVGLEDYDSYWVDPNSDTGIETLLSNPKGYIVGRVGDKLLRYKTDTHLLTIAPPGGGKTSGVLIPNLIDHQGSSVVIDIRGETVAKTANIKRLQGHRVIVLDPYEVTDGEYGNDSYNLLNRG